MRPGSVEKAMTPRRAHLEDLPGINQCIDAAFGVYVERMRKKPEPTVTDYRTHIINKNVYVIDLNTGDIGGVLVLIP